MCVCITIVQVLNTVIHTNLYSHTYTVFWGYNVIVRCGVAMTVHGRPDIMYNSFVAHVSCCDLLFVFVHMCVCRLSSQVFVVLAIGIFPHSWRDRYSWSAHSIPFIVGFFVFSLSLFRLLWSAFRTFPMCVAPTFSSIHRCRVVGSDLKIVRCRLGYYFFFWWLLNYFVISITCYLLLVYRYTKTTAMPICIGPMSKVLLSLSIWSYGLA